MAGEGTSVQSCGAPEREETKESSDLRGPSGFQKDSRGRQGMGLAGRRREWSDQNESCQ